jgi:serine/threonine protein kinase
MELLRIVFHGWKSDPGFIIDPFDEIGMYHKCKQDCAEFSASYDMAHKYVSNAHTDILGMAKRDSNGISKVQIPIFGPEHTIPGFTANSKSVWSMFGPLAGEKPVGSMKLDRTDPENATLLPINVKRIKIYPSVVNLMKNIMRLSGVDVRGLTHKRLKYQGQKVAEFLNELVLNWKKHAQVLMSFRIECTIELTDANYNLRELIVQHKECQEQLLKRLSANTTMSLIAISDIDSLSRWCLKKFMRLSTGDDKKKFHDEEMAKDMLLSLWHTIGYHHLAYTQQKHARFLLELNMQKVDMNSSENQPTTLLKTVLPARDFDWSDETKTSSLLQALTFMKIQKVTTKQKPNTFVFRYMYKKICTTSTNGYICPWCYSSKKMVKKLEDQEEKTQATMTACRSNNFENPIELALDVQARLQHHMQSCNPSNNNWDITKIQNVIGSLFFKCTENDKQNQNQEIIRVIQSELPNKGNAAADNSQIHTDGSENGASQCRVDLDIDDFDIDDLFRNEFDSIDDAIRDLCSDMNISYISCGTVPREWMMFFEQEEQTFIKLSDCVYASKRFAKGNATCHFAWNPRTQKPMCIKILHKTIANYHENNMLTKLMQHTGENPGRCNIIKYFGQEVRQNSIFLKFELVHPKNRFRKDLKNMTYPQVVTYMHELLKALDSLHNKYRITHRDIKPENFVHHFQTNTFRLIDFGSAVYSDNDVTSVHAGTRGFKAPELLHQSHGKKKRSVKRQPCIDIWSAGIIMMSLLTGKKDILSRNTQMATIDCNKKHFDEIGNIVGKKAMKDVNMPNWTQYSDGCKEGEKTGWAAKALQLSERSWTPNDDALDLLSQMLNVCPRKRITSDAALNHRFFKSQDILYNDGANINDNTANGQSNYTGSRAHDAINIDRHDGRQLHMDNLRDCEEEIINIDDDHDHSKSPNMSATGLPNRKNWCYQDLTLLIGQNVLARRDARSQWSPAFVKNGTVNECQVVFWTGREEGHTVTAENIKKMFEGDAAQSDDDQQRQELPTKNKAATNEARDGDGGASADEENGNDTTDVVISVRSNEISCAATNEATVEIRTSNGIHQDLTLLIGQNVLARRDARSQWSPAFVKNGTVNECQVVFWTGREEGHTVTAENIKKMDWKYWNTEMKSWTGDKFDEAIDGSNVEADVQGNIVALADLEIGVVVAKRLDGLFWTGLNAFTDEDGRAESKQQCNTKLWSVEYDNCSFSSKPNKAVFLVTTQRVQRGEKLAWLYKSHSTLCGSEDKMVMTLSVASNEEACTGNSDNINNKESQGQDNEPNIVQSIMFSMQGDTHHPGKSFDVNAYMDLWGLQAPIPKTGNITISGNVFEAKDFGSSIKPFLHQATIDLLLMTDITSWLDIDANNSFVIHLAMAMNKNPLALHTMFARNCSRIVQAKQDHVWIPDVLTAVLPSNLHFKIMILSRKPDDDTYTNQLYGSALHDAAETPELSAVLVRDGKSYSWLPGIRIHDVPIKKVQQNCQYSDCVKWETMTKKSLFIQGCHSSKSEAPLDWINGVWNSACTKVGLLKADSGKWEKKPRGINKDLSFQDGSLTPKSFELLRDLLSAKVNCETVADLGSEAGHAVAQFAFMPFVKQVIGIEIQYSWAAYSAIMINHLQLESNKNEYCLADIHIIHGSFLDTTISEWEAALSRADLCFCNNVNWEKGAKARPVPRHQQKMTSGESRNRINVNVAQLLIDRMKYDSHVLVFDSTSFTAEAYQKVSTLSLPATWNTITTQEICILQMRPTKFKVLKEALRTLCQAKKSAFEKLPREWWQNEVRKKGHLGFLRLKDYVLERDYFEKSNASVHFGWSVSPPRKVCIKQFPKNTQDADIQQEIRTLVRVAQNDDTTTNSVIRYYGAEPDRQGGTVLIFELVQASSITNTISDLQTMTRHQMAEYMYKLLQALNYLHRHDIVHRDVKPANFLHNFESKIFRLIDFGSADTGTEGFVRRGGGTRGFRAPETLIGLETQTAAVDVWSAGIILLSLITGKRYILTQYDTKVKGKVCDAEHLKEIEMIVGKTEMQQLYGQQCDTQGDESLREQCKKHRDGIEHEKQTGWAAKALQSSIPGRNFKNDDQVLDLLSQMLNVQPSKRITTAGAIEHPFFVSAGFCKRP